jgi:hypothetical protein
LLQLHRFAGHGDRQAFEIAHRRVGRIGRKSGVEQPHDRRTLVVQGYRDAMQNEITMKANGPTEVTNRPSVAAPANERKEDPQFRVGYYARCKQILADIEEAEAEANLLQATPRGLLRVAAPVTFGVLHIAPAASDYMMRYPEVTFDVAISDRFVDLIEEGFDVAIRIGDLQDSNLIARRIATARLVTCASPAYVRRAGTPQAPADLSRHACLILPE